MNTRWILRVFLPKIFTSGSRTLYSKRGPHSKWRFPRLIYQSTLRVTMISLHRVSLFVKPMSTFLASEMISVYRFSISFYHGKISQTKKWMDLVCATDFLKSTNEIQIRLFCLIPVCAEILCSTAAVVVGTFLQSDTLNI